MQQAASNTKIKKNPDTVHKNEAKAPTLTSISLVLILFFELFVNLIGQMLLKIL